MTPCTSRFTIAFALILSVVVFSRSPLHAQTAPKPASPQTQTPPKPPARPPARTRAAGSPTSRSGSQYAAAKPWRGDYRDNDHGHRRAEDDVRDAGAPRQNHD